MRRWKCSEVVDYRICTYAQHASCWCGMYDVSAVWLPRAALRHRWVKELHGYTMLHGWSCRVLRLCRGKLHTVHSERAILFFINLLEIVPVVMSCCGERTVVEEGIAPPVWYVNRLHFEREERFGPEKSSRQARTVCGYSVYRHPWAQPCWYIYISRRELLMQSSLHGTIPFRRSSKRQP
jgi:hypothetical protein